MRVRALLLAGLAALLAASPARADTWDVVGTGDSGTCSVAAHTCPSLRAAIAASEATKEVADTINVPAGVINIGTDLVIQSDITVIGANARTTIIDGQLKSRGFRITPSGNAKISHLTIRNGAAGQGGMPDGGGVLNLSGVAQLSHVRVTNSRADGRGGGIANYHGTLTLTHGLIDGNAADDGGGIANLGGAESPDRGLLGVAETTMHRNTAGVGGTGGLSSRGGQFNVLVLNRSTVADNVGGARGAGGLLVVSGAAQAVASVIARNTVGAETINCGSTKPVDGGFNVEDANDCALAGGDLNPVLATTLRNEGGELDVLPIGASSPAVDRVTANCSAGSSDARGLYRPQGAACDSGAYELDKPATVTITDGPTGVTTSAVEFRFTASEPGTVQCRLTGPGQSGGFAECYKSNAQPYSGLADGPYTFSVRALDGTFPDPPVATRAFVVDTGPPETTITDGPSGAVSSTSAAFTYGSSEAGSTFQCSLDGAAFGTCPTSYSGLAQGQHTFRVRAIDAANNTDQTPASRTWTVDTIKPAAPAVTTPSDGARLATSTVTFAGTAEPNATVEIGDGAVKHTTEVDADGAWAIEIIGAADGTHAYAVSAIDAAGNRSDAVTRTVHVDTGPPAAPMVTSGPAGPVNTASPQFTFTGEPGATFECSLDSPTQFTACASPKTYSGVGEGDHTFRVRTVDLAGNRGPAAVRAFSVDLTPPAEPAVNGPEGATTDASPGFEFSSDGGALLECRLDGPGGQGGFQACASPQGYSNLAPGDYVFHVRATDAAGNESTASRSFTVTAPQPAPQPPVPTPTPTPTPTPEPTPVAQQTVVVRPAGGKVLVRRRGSNRFEELDASQGIPLGSEVDVKRGRVQLTSVPRPGAPPETAVFYQGIFVVTQKRGITDLRLSEPLTGCNARARARAAQRKAKTRKLWGEGRGRFRTTGRYSSATVRGTKWLVQDTCTSTITRVTQGVVAVRDNVKQKTVIVRRGKRYTARATRR